MSLMEQDFSWWTCSCGLRLELPTNSIVRGTEVCPRCGASVNPLQTQDEPLEPSETQMINLDEMASMAQEGIDVGVSGEWDTRGPSEPRGKK